MSQRPRRSSCSTHQQTPHSRLITSHQSVKPQNPLRKHKNSDTPATSKQSEYRLTNAFSPSSSLKAVYHSASEAKYFALILLQDLVRLCRYDIYSYCLMLEMLANLSFEGYSETSIKIAITVFHIGSKFFNSNRPRLCELIAWSHHLVSASDIIACQEQIYRGFNYTLPTHQGLGIDEIQALCFELEHLIFSQEHF